MSSSIGGNPFLMLIFKNLDKNINFKLSCPFEPGVYEIKDLLLEVPELFSGPMFMMANSKVCTEMKTFGTVKGEKNVNDFLSFGGVGYFNLN